MLMFSFDMDFFFFFLRNEEGGKWGKGGERWGIDGCICLRD